MRRTALWGLLWLAVLSGCTPESDPQILEGYVVADWVYVAAPATGWLSHLAGESGDTLEPGDDAFVLEDTYERHGLKAAEAEVAAARARAEDLRAGARAEELAAIDAQIEEARANVAYAEAERKRWLKLVEQGLASPATADQVNEKLEVARARLKTLQANRKVAELGAREARQREAQAGAEAASARRDQAAWILDQRHVSSRTGGRIERVFYREGELVTAGSPVLALLPPDHLKVRFYIPETRRAQFHPGQTVTVFQDGEEPVRARIRYLSADVEHTPPVIFSERTRASLVFVAEAVPEADQPPLHPGMPVEVRP